MGLCGSTQKDGIQSDISRNDVLSLVRGGKETLGNARLMHHLMLWDEYANESPPKVLGTGMNGPVIRIHSKRNPSMQYALKQVDKKNVNIAEIAIYLEIDHPNICKILEVYSNETQVSIVTELCSHGDLFSRLKREIRFNEISAIVVVRQILKAVSYLHSLGIVHGDLKLENFVYAAPNILRLIDFGFAHKKNLDPTHMGGSPLYMAPELLQEPKRSTMQSDMWSIGIIVYMMLTGKILPDHCDLEKIVNRDFTYLKLSQSSANFIIACLQEKPDNRISAREALKHAWMNAGVMASLHRQSGLGEDQIEKGLKLLVEFSKLGPLRRASLGLIALHSPSTCGKQVDALFSLLDTNGDGFIRESELIHALEERGLECNIFPEIDLTGDGRINFSELLAGTEIFDNCKSLRQPKTQTQAVYAELIKSVFRKLDVDNSGFISRENLQAVFGRKGYMGSDVGELIEEGDFKGDGIISQEEFFQLVTSSN